MSEETPQAAKHVTRLLLELLKGRKLSIQDVMDETGRAYQTARRYLAALDDVVGLEAEHRGSAKVWYLPPPSIAVHPEVYVEDTGQLPLFGKTKEAD